VSPSTRTWPTRTLNVLVPVVGIDLILQYIAGLGSNAYGPSTGFTVNTDFGIYDIHWLNGYVLGILSIILVLVAAISRQARNVLPAIVALAAVLIAGFAGMAFVSSAPNPPGATVTMGIAFLVAFATILAMMFRLRKAVTGPTDTLSGATSPT